jgi:hypothetical protein
MIRQYKRTIPAGAVVKIDGMGQPEFVHFRECDDTNAVVSILATNSQGQVVIDAQLLSGQGFNGSKMFSHLALENKSAGEIVATFVVGSGAFTDERINGEVSTKISAVFAPLTDLVMTGASQTIASNSSRGAITLYSSESNAGAIHIGSAGASIPLKAGGSIVLPTTAAVQVVGTVGDTLHAIEI